MERRANRNGCGGCRNLWECQRITEQKYAVSSVSYAVRSVWMDISNIMQYLPDYGYVNSGSYRDNMINTFITEEIRGVIKWS